MSKHTPGPWTMLPAEDDVPYIRVRGTRLGCRFKVANALFVAGHPAEQAEAIANARLIAAAPDLLGALQDLDARLRECMRDQITAAEAYDSSYQSIVAEAIQKATGEPS